MARSQTLPPLPSEGGSYLLENGKWILTQRTELLQSEPPAPPKPADSSPAPDPAPIPED